VILRTDAMQCPDCPDYLLNHLILCNIILTRTCRMAADVNNCCTRLKHRPGLFKNRLFVGSTGTVIKTVGGNVQNTHHARRTHIDKSAPDIQCAVNQKSRTFGRRIHFSFGSILIQNKALNPNFSPVIEKTAMEYRSVIETCRSLFEKKTRDYGTAWRILRLPS